MTWRPMTAEELVTRSEARLGGSLLLIVVCAAVLAVAGVIALVFALISIPALLSSSSTRGLFSSGPAGVAALHAVTMVYLLVWAIVFSILSLIRSPLTPSFAAGGLAGWAGVRLVISIGGQFLIASQYNGGAAMILQTVPAMLLAFLGELMLVAGFWIYMRDGARPNGYYRRLVGA